MASAPSPRIPELVSLTSIRGLAAWWVVLFHMRALLAPWLPAQALAFLAHGNLAVDLFFILSGFVMALNYGERVEEGGTAAYGDFLVRRLARIYPLHLLILAGFAAYALAAARFGSARLEEQNWGYFFSSLLLVQNWGFTSAPAWNAPAWSISAELFAYFVFPLLLALLRPLRRRLWTLALAVLVLGVCVQLLFRVLGHPFPNAVAQTGLFRCLLQFAMGMALFGLWARLPRAGWLPPSLLAAAAALGAAFVLWNAPTIPLAWAALILALALLPRARPLDAPVLVWLGRVSYATYLSHYLILTLFKYAFVGADARIGPAAVLLFLVVVLAASAALYHGIERPAQRAILAWWAARGRRRGLAPA